MRQRSTKLITLFLIASLLLTSCSAGVFQGQRGVQLAAQEMAPKPPLEITSNNKAFGLVDHTQALMPAFTPGNLKQVPSSFGCDLEGELYLCDLKGGRVFKLVP